MLRLLCLADILPGSNSLSSYSSDIEQKNTDELRVSRFSPHIG